VVTASARLLLPTGTRVKTVELLTSFSWFTRVRRGKIFASGSSHEKDVPMRGNSLVTILVIVVLVLLLIFLARAVL
jgi:hypothetical protein